MYAIRSYYVQRTLNDAASAMSKVFETHNIFDEISRVLHKNGFECMLLLFGSDLSVQKTYLSFADTLRVYRDEESTQLSNAFREAAYERRA